MKLTTKLTAVLAAAAFFTGTAFADDFSNDFGTDAPADTAGADASSSVAAPAVTISGKAEEKARAYVNDQSVDIGTFDDVADLPITTDPSLTLNVDYSGTSSDIAAKLTFDKDSLGDYKEDILEELTARAYVGNWIFEAGKMKIVWGKGDKLHVLDNFNANDYTDYIIPDYIDRRIAEPMFHVVYNLNDGGRIEAVYTPMMTPDRLATSGVWEPAQATSLTDSVTNYASTQLGTLAATKDATWETVYTSTYNQMYATVYAAQIDGGATAATAATAATTYATTNAGTSAAANTTYQTALASYLTALTNASALNSDSSELYPDTNNIRYGQAGLRLTETIGAVDYGVSYYYGHYKQPSCNVSKMQSYIINYLAGTATESEKFLDYDQLQVFGLEAAFVAGPLNTRWEAAYNLTKDVDGDDPAVHNNSVAWVGGFDVDLPVHNINVNIQETGKYILHGDEIKDGTYAAYDVDKDANNCWTNNKVVVNISDTFNHEKVKPEVSVLYGIERGDLLVMPKLTINVKDNFDFIVNGLCIHCKDSDSEFYSWEHNSFAQMGIKYQF
jgi:hypothetical protein